MLEPPELTAEPVMPSYPAVLGLAVAMLTLLPHQCCRALCWGVHEPVGQRGPRVPVAGLWDGDHGVAGAMSGGAAG